MTTLIHRTGAELLARRSTLNKLRRTMPALRDFLIIDQSTFEADILRAVLHLMFGYAITLRFAPTLGQALDHLIERAPDLVFLDDRLPPNGGGRDVLPIIRKCGYEGPIIVVTSCGEPLARLALLNAGAADVVDRDELDSVRIAEALTCIQRPSASSCAPDSLTAGADG